VELKHDSRAFNLNLFYWFESNQSGIETKIQHHVEIGVRSLNRTKVELKQNEK